MAKVIILAAKNIDLQPLGQQPLTALQPATVQQAATWRAALCAMLCNTKQINATGLVYVVIFDILKHRTESSQRSLQNAPIFRLLLKVAVKGTH